MNSQGVIFPTIPHFLRLGSRVLLTRSLGWEGGGLLAIWIVPPFCMEGGLSDTTSGAKSAKASFSCSEAGIGKQVSMEAQPQGEGSSNFEARPSSRKEEKDLNLNLSSHPHRATEELFNDLLQADRRLDELMGKAPSLQNARDLDAWGRELKKEQECFAETEQG
ncbi:hypothetical protein ACH5RR_023539 [Cinchona calisaya]|uniref:Uncharacterized protein n=1 Tax=Cinchona calisaya TaxID=153742 RepID=A0ABD2ZE39_9GENT